VAPSVIRQDVPPWPRQLGTPPLRNGVLEVVITEEGTVASARVVQGVHPLYDQLVLAAVSSWSYTPARLEGAPVKFRKMLKLTFK
jgi:TonB family protein